MFAQRHLALPTMTQRSVCWVGDWVGDWDGSIHLRPRHSTAPYSALASTIDSFKCYIEEPVRPMTQSLRVILSLFCPSGRQDLVLFRPLPLALLLTLLDYYNINTAFLDDIRRSIQWNMSLGRMSIYRFICRWTVSVVIRHSFSSCNTIHQQDTLRLEYLHYQPAYRSI